ncbi:MAG: radical SAM protein [Magnetovibrio sp.]|nr:radical SAM protein [Magnetovibrio sp.]
MEHFTIEQFLPCREPELATISQRKALPQGNVQLCLAHDVMAVPMSSGFKVSWAGGDVYVRDMGLLRELETGRLSTREAARRGMSDVHEMEQLNAAGLISTDISALHHVREAKIADRYRRLYDEGDWTWFCMSPDKLEIDLTNRCNLTCVHCSREASPHADVDPEMKPQQLFALVAEAADIGATSLSLMGGEPTVHPHLLDLAHFAKKKGIHSLSTSTNGLRVKAEMAERMAYLFSSLQVSLHGCDAQTHDRIVQHDGAFKAATNAVRLMIKYGAPAINVAFSVMPQNRSQIEDAVKMAQDLGATSVRFLALTAEGRASCLPMLSCEDKSEISDELRRLRETLAEDTRALDVQGGGFPIYLPFNNKAAVYGCPAGRTLMYVEADGAAHICHAVHDTVGNVTETALLDLWHHPDVRTIRRRISCDCSYTSIWAGGCLANPEWMERFQSPQSKCVQAKCAQASQSPSAPAKSGAPA